MNATIHSMYTLHISNRYSPYSTVSLFLHSDFGGWPDAETGVLPIEYLSEENRQIIAEKCSGKENPIMPNVPTALCGRKRKSSKTEFVFVEKEGGDEMAMAPAAKPAAKYVAPPNDTVEIASIMTA